MMVKSWHTYSRTRLPVSTGNRAKRFSSLTPPLPLASPASSSLNRAHTCNNATTTVPLYSTQYCCAVVRPNTESSNRATGTPASSSLNNGVLASAPAVALHTWVGRRDHPSESCSAVGRSVAPAPAVAAAVVCACTCVRVCVCVCFVARSQTRESYSYEYHSIFDTRTAWRNPFLKPR